MLAELESQLRLFPSDSHADAASWSVLFHLEVQADLLGGVAGEFGEKALLEFTDSLASLVSLGQEEPQRIPVSWQGGFNLLATFLEVMAAGLDSGDSLEQWLKDARWQRLISWFENFETPNLVFSELQEILLQWQKSWCDKTLDPAQEIELKNNWVSLRQFGDALFSPSVPDSGSSLLPWKDFDPGI